MLSLTLYCQIVVQIPQNDNTHDYQKRHLLAETNFAKTQGLPDVRSEYVDDFELMKEISFV